MRCAVSTRRAASSRSLPHCSRPHLRQSLTVAHRASSLLLSALRPSLSCPSLVPSRSFHSSRYPLQGQSTASHQPVSVPPSCKLPPGLSAFPPLGFTSKDIRALVDSVCAHFPDDYWRNLDIQSMYPVEFVRACTDAGLFCLRVPKEQGGLGDVYSISTAAGAAIIDQMHTLGSNGSPVHSLLFMLGIIARFGTEEQKKRWLPKLSAGRLRLQSFAMAERDTDDKLADTRTTALLDGDHFVVNGAKTWTSRTEYSDLMLVTARTSNIANPRDGLSLLMVDIRKSLGSGLTVRPIPTQLNVPSSQVFFDSMWVPKENLIGEIDQASKYILWGTYVQQVFISAGCIGDSRWFLRKALDVLKEKASGLSASRSAQLSLPLHLAALAKAFAHIEAAALTVQQAAVAIDESSSTVETAVQIAKYLAANACWMSAESCMAAYGALGFYTEHDIERKWREAKLLNVSNQSTTALTQQLSEDLFKA